MNEVQYFCTCIQTLHVFLVQYFYSFSLMWTILFFGFIPITLASSSAPPEPVARSQLQKNLLYSILRGALMIFQPRTSSYMAGWSHFPFVGESGISIHTVQSHSDSTHFFTYNIYLAILNIIITNLVGSCRHRSGRGYIMVRFHSSWAYLVYFLRKST